jgi:hypothetical protein
VAGFLCVFDAKTGRAEDSVRLKGITSAGLVEIHVTATTIVHCPHHNIVCAIDSNGLLWFYKP